MAKSEVPKLEPLSYFMGQLDLSEYDSRAEINRAARKLRDARRAELAELRADERHRNKMIADDWKAFQNRQLSTAEKRALVSQGTHRWCRGVGGCGGKGYLVGRDGVRLPHGPCKSDGLIKVKGGTKSGPGRGRSTRRPSRPFADARGRARGRSRGPVRRLRATRRRPRGRARNAAVGGGLVLGAGVLLGGSVGLVVAGVLLVLMLVLAVLGGLARLVTR